MMTERPEWTAEAPTEPGLYWFSLLDSDGALRFCKVFEYDGEMCVITESSPVRVAQMHRVWAGPLRHPVGTAAHSSSTDQGGK